MDIFSVTLLKSMFITVVIPIIVTYVICNMSIWTSYIEHTWISKLKLADNKIKLIKRIICSHKLWIWIILIIVNQFVVYVLLAEYHPEYECEYRGIVPDGDFMLKMLQMAVIIVICGYLILYNAIVAIYYLIKKKSFLSPIWQGIKMFIFMIILLMTLIILYFIGPFDVEICDCRKDYSKGSCCGDHVCVGG